MSEYIKRTLRICAVALVLALATLGVQGLAQTAVNAAATDPGGSTTLTTNQKEVCDAIGSPDCNDNNNGGKDVNSIITTVIKIFSGVIGVVAVVMIMTAGFKYITSSGDAAKVTSAKNTLLYAIIGLVIAVLAQVIVKFVLHSATK
ncbi:MAG: pilin [Candidatus Saccharimonadales bacterium]